MDEQIVVRLCATCCVSGFKYKGVSGIVPETSTSDAALLVG